MTHVLIQFRPTGQSLGTSATPVSRPMPRNRMRTLQQCCHGWRRGLCVITCHVEEYDAVGTNSMTDTGLRHPPRSHHRRDGRHQPAMELRGGIGYNPRFNGHTIRQCQSETDHSCPQSPGFCSRGPAISNEYHAMMAGM